MQHLPAGLYLILLLLHPLTSAEDVGEVPVEVIVGSSLCSTTCGLGVKTQTLCLLRDGKLAMEGVRNKDEAEVTKKCRVRKVTCQETWQCGLRTMTVTSGQRVEIDCLVEVTEVMGRFSWRVLWRYARGIITTDDSLFARWKAPKLDSVILDPVGEEDAGTYRCDVQDATFHMVKSIYWGIRVLPAKVLSLDYESGLDQWETSGSQQNQTVSDQLEQRMALPYMVLISFSLAVVLTGLMLLCLYWNTKRRKQRHFSRCSINIIAN